MDIFTKFNRKNVQDRQVDTLIGLCKGICADQIVNKVEADFLQSWLVQNAHTANPVILNLLDRLDRVLDDGVLSKEEASELLSVLLSISGEKSALGELGKTATLPVCSPPPDMTFANKHFLFTGTCAFGTRGECHKVIESMGGINLKNVNQKLDYLILGTYVTDSWAHESYGRKIEKAIEYRDKGMPISIVTEKYWLEQAGL